MWTGAGPPLAASDPSAGRAPGRGRRLRARVPDGPAAEGLGGLAPDAHRAMLGLEGAVWLEPRLRELVEVRAAQLDGCADSLLRHARDALALGETRERLAELARWRASPLFDDRERAALRLTEALVLLSGGDTVAAACREAAERFEARELAQLVFACVAATAWNRLELAAGGRPGPGSGDR